MSDPEDSRLSPIQNVMEIEQLARDYKRRAEVTSSWRHYVQAHGLANFCVCQESTEVRRRLVYEIENSWYKGEHPLTYVKHQQLTDKHKRLLETYREQTKEDIKVLDGLVRKFDQSDVVSQNNLEKADNFCEEVFQVSKKCSEGLLQVSRQILQKSVELLRNKGDEAPCRFAIIGMGSIAKGDATPYSDLEYFIIVEKESDYFERLAVDSYFRIGNLGESPLKTFDITELKADGKRHHQVGVSTVGYRIDGLTAKSGNIPTGNGKGGVSLTCTVDQLMELYKREAAEPFRKIPGDKSDMLSSTVVLLANDEAPPNSQLYSQFLSSRETCEDEELRNYEAVKKKRLDSFVADIKKYKFLPGFVQFQPPNNTKVEVKEDILRYPTLLANNMKMCLRLRSTYSWEIYAELNELGVLSPKTCRYINIVLAISIYLRTSAYVQLRTQKDVVPVEKYNQDSHEPSHGMPAHMVALMGCLLIPIKRSIKASVSQATSAEDTMRYFDIRIRSILQNVKEGGLDVSLGNHWTTAEVLYFTGQYDTAKTEVSKELSEPLDSISYESCCAAVSSTIQHDDTTVHQKRLELCAYLLYYTENYNAALQYFVSFCNEQKERHFWKLIAAHCYSSKDPRNFFDWSVARQLLREVEEANTSEDEVNAVANAESNHKDTMLTCNNFGLLYRVLGKCEKALLFYRRGLEINCNVYGNSSNIDVAISHINIASVQEHLGADHAALGEYNRALVVFQRIYGKESEHSDIKNVEESIEKVKSRSSSKCCTIL